MPVRAEQGVPVFTPNEGEKAAARTRAADRLRGQDPTRSPLSINSEVFAHLGDNAGNRPRPVEGVRGGTDLPPSVTNRY